eukprot:253333_1
MLRCHPAKLIRSSFITHTYSLQALSINLANKPSIVHPFYHQSLFQSQRRPTIPKPQSIPMSGSALDSLKELMSMIDEFELSVENQTQPKQSSIPQNQASKPSPSLPTQTQNTNIPSSLIDSHLPIDAAFRPQLPQGHTPYSWCYSNIYSPSKSEPSAKKVNQPIAKSQQKKAKAKQQKTQAKKAKASKGNKRKIVPKKMLKAGDRDDSKQSFERRDHLRSIEKDVQKEWDKAKVFESNPIKDKPKFMCTFPYPYMNGFLHLGHAFTITKAEFRAGYERLRGKNVLFPFAFHCTGMPIAAAARRIKSEVETYGDPPQFPTTQSEDKLEDKQAKHSKLESKKSG